MLKIKYVYASAAAFLLLLTAFFLSGSSRPGIRANAESVSPVASRQQDEAASIVKAAIALPRTEFSHKGAPLKTESVYAQQSADAQKAAQQAAPRRYSLSRGPSSSSRGASQDRAMQDSKSKVQLLPWYGKAENIFIIGAEATVVDIETGLSFKVKRTYGYNHADVETLTAEDTETMKKIAGGKWSWERRAVIVEVDNYRIAASATFMPHAGRDDKPANIFVSGRSGGYGRGENLDAVKGNKMDGHFDIHFYKSRTHATNRVDRQAQEMVRKAYRLASKNG